MNRWELKKKQFCTNHHSSVVELLGNEGQISLRKSLLRKRISFKKGEKVSFLYTKTHLFSEENLPLFLKAITHE